MIHPQYYGVQAPWGIYPANLIQQQGQHTPQGPLSQGQGQQQGQMMRNQSGRPLTPQQNDNNLSQQNIQPPALQTPSKSDLIDVGNIFLKTGSTVTFRKPFYAPGLKGPPGASSNWIVRLSVCLSVCLSICLSVRNSVPLTNKVQ